MCPQSRNPIKTCFYARWWTAEEKRGLKKSSPDAADEAANLRTFAGGLTQRLSRKDPGDYSNEDLKLLTSLVAKLDRLEWRTSLPSVIVPGGDPLEDMDGRF
jgi:hypothetical protein